MKHARLHHKLLLLSQRIDLRLNNLRVTRDTEIVIAIKTDGVWTWRFAMQYKFSTPLFVPARREITRYSGRQVFADGGIVKCLAGRRNFAFENLHV